MLCAALPLSRMNNQAGVSLIGLMVGLLISMIGILAIFSSYKTLISSAVQSHSEVNYDGAIDSVLVRAQLEMQSAGYGLPAPAGAGAPAGAAHYLVAPTYVAWRTLWPNATGALATHCFKIEDSPFVVALNQAQARQVEYFAVDSTNAANNCTATSDLATVVWGNAAANLGVFTPGVVTDLVGKTTPLPPVFNFAETTVECSPYGVSAAPSAHPLITMTAPRSVEQTSGSAFPDAQISVCLSNI